VPYGTWKQDLVDSFIEVSVQRDSAVLEIGVGHGRWTPPLAARSRSYVGVDLSPSCIRYCRRRFRTLPNCSFQVTNGQQLPAGRGDIDFVWSFDTFVLIEKDVTSAYLAEVARVLVVGGRACIHHAGTPTASQRVAGWRSAVTAGQFASLATASGLRVVTQCDSWGPNRRSNTKLAADCISTLLKPSGCGQRAHDSRVGPDEAGAT
jgi:ubiquinone/menaquinone biosynthesis C-methylase UbiE